MKLYTTPGACSTAVHIALQWTNEPFDVEIVPRGSIEAAAFPFTDQAGSAPILVDGDFKLTQNPAIMGYIADAFPQAGLLGLGDPRQRAEATRWLSFVNADMHQAFRAYIAPGAYLPDAELRAALQICEKGRLRGMYERLEIRLMGREWIAGFRSAADAYLYITLRWADTFYLNMHGLDELAAFKRRMESDVGVQAVLAREGLVVQTLQAASRHTRSPGSFKCA